MPDADVPVPPDSTPTTPAKRASNRGFLPITLDEYLELLDWTGRQVRADKRGAIPDNLLPILRQLQVNADAWIDIDRCEFFRDPTAQLPRLYREYRSSRESDPGSPA